MVAMKCRLNSDKATFPIQALMMVSLALGLIKRRQVSTSIITQSHPVLVFETERLDVSVFDKSILAHHLLSRFIRICL